MVTNKKRILSWKEVDIQDIGGKMRLMIFGSFYAHPSTGSAFFNREAEHLKVDLFGDGSCLATLVKLVPSDISEDAIEAMQDAALAEMEELMGFEPEEELSSSGWSAGFSNTDYDAYLSNEDAAFLAAQLAEG